MGGGDEEEDSKMQVDSNNNNSASTGSGSSSSATDMDVEESVDQALTAAEKVLALAEKEVSLLNIESLSVIKEAKGYDGPKIRFPLKLESVLNMMEEFKTGKSLHYKYTHGLVSSVQGDP